MREIKVIECFLSTSNSHFFFWNSLCLTRSSLSSFPWGTSYPSPYGFGKLQVVTYFEGREGKGKFSWQGPDRKKSTPLFFQFRNLKSSSGRKKRKSYLTRRSRNFLPSYLTYFCALQKQLWFPPGHFLPALLCKLSKDTRNKWTNESTLLMVAVAWASLRGRKGKRRGENSLS